MENIIQYSADNFPKGSDNYFESRTIISEYINTDPEVLVDICVLGYNKVYERTKICVEAILKYTVGISYRLILIDNGSTDDTLNFYKSVQHPNKLILSISENTSTVVPEALITPYLKSKYYVRMGNDVIVTYNWLANLLKAAESDSNFGMLIPCITNSGFFQAPNLPKSSMTIEEIDRYAKEFNVSDSKKWHERTAVLPSLCLMRKSCLDAVGHIWDVGMIAYCDIDLSYRVRRAGYKNIICTDTLVHHNHIYTDDTVDDDSLESNNSAKFSIKYPNIHPWNDSCFWMGEIIECFTPSLLNGRASALGVDVRCGAGLLEVKNKLRENDVANCSLYSFTSQSQYVTDLYTICKDVKCDRIDYISDYYTAELFDYIILGEPVNTYNKPLTVIQKLYEFLKKDGTLLFKLRNTADIRNLLYTMGNLNSLRDEDMPSCINVDDMNSFLTAIGAKDINIITQSHSIDKSTSDKVKHIITSALQTKNVDDALMRAVTADYLFCVKK